MGTIKLRRVIANLDGWTQDDMWELKDELECRLLPEVQSSVDKQIYTRAEMEKIVEGLKADFAKFHMEELEYMAEASRKLFQQHAEKLAEGLKAAAQEDYQNALKLSDLEGILVSTMVSIDRVVSAAPPKVLSKMLPDYRKELLSAFNNYQEEHTNHGQDVYALYPDRVAQYERYIENLNLALAPDSDDGEALRAHPLTDTEMLLKHHRLVLDYITEQKRIAEQLAADLEKAKHGNRAEDRARAVIRQRLKDFAQLNGTRPKAADRYITTINTLLKTGQTVTDEDRSAHELITRTQAEYDKRDNQEGYRDWLRTIDDDSSGKLKQIQSVLNLPTLPSD